MHTIHVVAILFAVECILDLVYHRHYCMRQCGVLILQAFQQYFFYTGPVQFVPCLMVLLSSNRAPDNVGYQESIFLISP